MHIERFLEEDIGKGDITSDALLGDEQAEGHIIAKERCVLAGIEEASLAFKQCMVSTTAMAKVGVWIEDGTKVMHVSGPARGILKAERVALNMMMRMSGIATRTRTLVDICRRVNPLIIIAATRKTTPGFRYFEKKAVRIGGGDPHRYGLDDAVLIKDNHIKAMGSVGAALQKARAVVFGETTAPGELRSEFAYKKIEIEVENMDQLAEALDVGADIIMLDNMTPDLAQKAYVLIKERSPRTVVEVSGGLNDYNVAEYAKYGDVLSIGSLTHSYRSTDFSLELDIGKK